MTWAELDAAVGALPPSLLRAALACCEQASARVARRGGDEHVQIADVAAVLARAEHRQVEPDQLFALFGYTLYAGNLVSHADDYFADGRKPLAARTPLANTCLRIRGELMRHASSACQ